MFHAPASSRQRTVEAKKQQPFDYQRHVTKWFQLYHSIGRKTKKRLSFIAYILSEK
jgi:hypothetical protein